MAQRMPRAGDLRCRVTVEEDRGATDDAHGQHVPDWVPLATVWAGITALTGRELSQARQVQAEVTHEVWLRAGAHLGALHAAQRLTLGLPPRVLEVVAARRVGEGRQAWWCLDCREPGPAAGGEG